VTTRILWVAFALLVLALLGYAVLQPVSNDSAGTASVTEYSTSGVDSGPLGSEETPTATQAQDNAAENPAGTVVPTLGEETPSEEERLKLLSAALDDPRTYAAIHEVLENSVGTAEADFHLDLMNISSWDEASQRIDEQSKLTGQPYNDLRMKIGLSSGRISADEIIELAMAGTPIPDNAVHKLARAGRVDTIAALVQRGMIQDINSFDPASGRSVLNEFVRGAVAHPQDHSAAEVAAAVQTLVGLGAGVSPQAASQDPLYHALRRTYPHNAEISYAITAELLRQGASVDQRHRELLEALPTGITKSKFAKLFANYL